MRGRGHRTLWRQTRLLQEIMKRGRVKKMLFDDLVESIKEAGKIHRGEMSPSREFVFAPVDIKAIRKGLSKSRIEELEDQMLLEKAKEALREKGRIPWGKIKKDLGL